MAAHLEQTEYGLAGKLIDHVERTWSIRGTGIVAQIEVIVSRKQLADAMKDGESAVTAIEDANRAWIT
jgi:hypothetical protein